MSTYFSIYTKPKNLPDAKSLCLFFLCTTPARELDEDMCFAYDKETPVDCKLIDEIMEVYKDKIAEYEDFIKRHEEEKVLLMNALPKASNEDNYVRIKNDIMDNDSYISETKEDIEICKSRLSSLATVYNIIDDADNRVYEFYYIYA